jgi:cytochrome c-type biogenesis protein
MTLESFLSGFASNLPHGVFWSLAVAFAAGIMASAVCPCTLPMGMGLASVVGTAESHARKSGFWVAIAFFGGIAINLAVLGAVAGRLGVVLSESFGRYWTLAMAIASFLAALAAFWGPRLGADRLAQLRKSGLMGAFLYGFIFSLGTSAAPLLLLLTFAASQGSTMYGFILTLAFGIGRGAPFLLVGLCADAVVRLARLGLWRRAVQIASGSALLIVSAYYGKAFAALL